MNRTITRLIASATFALVATLPSVASAQSTWYLYNGSSNGSGCSQNSTNSGSFGNSWSCTSRTGGTAGTSLTASAYSSQNASSGSYVQSTTPSSGSGTYYANAYLNEWGSSGFGAANRAEGLGPSSPNHAFDNIPTGAWDGALLNFGSTPYVLSSLGVGWTDGSSADITLLQWTGSGSPTAISNTNPATGGKSLLAGSGWSLVGSYKGLTGDSSLPFGNTARNTGAATASSYWLVTAFNTALNGGSSSCLKSDGTSTTCDQGNDAFKLNFVTTTVAPGGGGGGSAPEPASLALVAAAMLGAFATRRRRTAG